MSDVTLEQIAAHCTKLGMMNRIEAERKLVETVIVTKHGTYLLFLRPDAERDVLQLRVPQLVATPAVRRVTMARVIAHLNYNLLLKGFVLDGTDGEVAYDLPIPFRGVGFSPEQVTQCLQAALWTLNTHLPTLKETCSSSASFEELVGLPLPEPAAALARALADGGTASAAASD